MAAPMAAGQREALETLRAGGGDRAAVYSLENEAGTPIYVHAKVCVIDDVWAAVGSDNLNLRSWTHDSELSCSILDAAPDRREPHDPAGLGDGARRFTRDLRIRLWAERLGREPDDPMLVDTLSGWELWRETADALDRWERAGRHGPRPTGQTAMARSRRRSLVGHSLGARHLSSRGRPRRAAGWVAAAGPLLAAPRASNRTRAPRSGGYTSRRSWRSSRIATGVMRSTVSSA